MNKAIENKALFFQIAIGSLSTLWLFAIFAFTWVAYSGGDCTVLYANIDGGMFSWISTALVKWSTPFNVIALNPFQGMVSTFLPVNSWWNPGALAVSLPFDLSINHIISYSIYWLEAFFSLFFLARSLKLTTIQSILVGQTFLLFFFPPFSQISLIGLAPYVVHLMVVSNLMFITYIALGEESRNKNFILLLLLMFLSFVLFISSVFYSVFYVATYGLMCAGYTFQYLNRSSILWKVSALFCISALLLIFKIPAYYEVLEHYGARTLLSSSKLISFHFPSKWPTYSGPKSIIISPFYVFFSFKNPFSYLYALSFLGGVMGLLRRQYRWISLCFLIIALLPDLLRFCFDNSIIQGRITQISPQYLAMASQAFFMLFFILFFSFLWESFISTMNRFSFNYFKKVKFKEKKISILSCFALMIAPLVASLLLYLEIRENSISSTQSKSEQVIIEYLRKQVSLDPGDRFRGSVISYFASADSSLRKTIDCGKSAPSSPLDHYINTRLYLKRSDVHGSTHMLSDLWKYNIPTLEEYAQMINVPMLIFWQNLLNFSALSKDPSLCRSPVVSLEVYDLDLRVLSALGVRFIITDSILNHAGVTKILEQTPRKIEGISLYGVKNAMNIYESFLNPEKFRAFSHSINSESDIEKSQFLSEFMKEIQKDYPSTSDKDIQKVIAGLSSALDIVTKDNLNKKIELSDLKEAKNYFYGYLHAYIMSPTLFLYEINRPNLGTFSPTLPIYLADENKIFSLLRDPHFSFENSVVIQEKDLPSPLVSAKDASIRFEPNEIHVQAESSDWSLLLLPVQYSHCFYMSPAENVRFIRANLVQSALLFKGKIDQRIQFQFSVNCRREDIKDGQQLFEILKSKLQK